MKRKLLASLLALCGLTAFAVDPVAVWNGDFTETTKGDYMLSANGNTVAADGSSITISTQKGVTFERSSALGGTVGMTVIYKFDNLVVGSTVKTIGTASAGGGNADRVGVNVQTSEQTSGIWENTKTYNTNATQTTISSIASEGQFALVYGPAVSNNTGTYLYLKNGIADYTLSYSCGGLKGGNDTVQAMTVGGTRNNGGTFPAASGMVIKAVALFDQALTKDQISAYAFPVPPPKVEPVLLFNVYNGNTEPEDNGWINHTQNGDMPSGTSSNLPYNGPAEDPISHVTFQVVKSAGKFFAQNEPTVDFATDSSYTDVFGETHSTITDEIKASLILPESVVFDETIYKTGVMNGGHTDHTATISGLTPGNKYLVYIGMGRNMASNTGIKIVQGTGYSEVKALEYVKTGASTVDYQTFASNTDVTSDNGGMIIFRLNEIVPVNDSITFTMRGGKGGLNFLAVAKVNETVTYTTAEIEGGSEISVAAINDALTETNNKAEVTLNAGATVYVDVTPLVPTKFICEGSITLSNTTKPNLTNLDLSGVTGGVVRTWLTEAEKKGIGFNFAKGCGPNTSQALVETAWYDNAKNNNGTDCAFSSDGLTTITYTSKNTYNDSGNNNDDSNGTLVKGYLDDGNGDGVQITVKNIPFAEYAVIIYASTDQSGKTLSFKKVNGVAYTYDSANKEVAKMGEDAWGACQSSSSVEYGRNAIRVVAQKNGTLTIESKRDDSKNVRGCVSAIQIVPYRTFVEPTVSIASVETKCSSNYASNTITGTIAEYVANSWTGDLTARVVVNSTVYESEAIADNAFSIEVSGLTQENVYRTVLEIGYTDGNVFTAIATQPVALYQGEQKFVWIASPFVIQEKTTVNDAQGLTIENPFKDADYVDLCDSEYTVSISASEEVDADSDEELDGTEQGGVRIAKTTSGLELQVIDNGEWKKFADAEVDTTYTMTVKFHYQKSQEDETADTSVMYALNATTNFMTNATSKKRVTEIFVSDGTKLSNDLWGACQLDKAVVVDIELSPGEGDVIDYATEEAATAALQTLKVGICDAVKGVLTTADAQATYRSYFHLVVVPSKTLENGFSVQPEFTFETQTAIEKEIEDAMAKVLEGFNTGSTEIKAKPGLYYGVKRGDKLDSMNTVETTMATSEKVTIKIVKPENSKSHFYRIIVSPTPATK